MSVVDYYAAKLKCQNCGNVSQDDTSTGMQNHLMSFGEPRIFRVGTCIEDLNLADLESEYLTVNKPLNSEFITALEDWTCPNCQNHNWAEIVFNDKRIENIKDVKITKKLLDEINFVTYDIDEPFEWIVGKPMYENGKMKSNFIEILKEHLTL